MRAFVTGASGFIASHLVSDLLGREWEVRVLVHRSQVPAARGLDIVRGGLGDTRLLQEQFRGVDVLYHLASALGSAKISRNEFFEVNARGTENVLRAAREAGVKRMIHFSSAGVLGHVPQGRTADEDFPLDPRDVYDRSKLEGEKEALRQSESGADVVVIRPGWVYGPRDRRTFKLIRAIARGRFVLVTRGKALQTPVHVRDLLAGIELCRASGKKGEVYNLAGPEVLTVKEIVEAIARAAGRKLPPFHLPLWPVKAAARILGASFSLLKKEAPLNMSRLAFFIHPKPLSIQKAGESLGYSPRIGFEEGVTETVRWYRENGWL